MLIPMLLLVDVNVHKQKPKNELLGMFAIYNRNYAFTGSPLNTLRSIGAAK